MARSWWLPALALAGILVGAAVWLAEPGVAHWIWLAVLVATGFVVVRATVIGIWHGRWAADIIAMVAILTAVAMGEALAGLIIVLMQTGGEALERYAEGRASEAVRALEADRPQIAHRLQDDGTLADVPVDDVRVGDRLLVRPGELVPCDGVVVEGTPLLDTSRITGEPLPRSADVGSTVSSGSGNGNRPFTMQATAVARESQYEQIVALVRTAQATKAPFQRLADRYAVWFTPITLLVAGVAWAVTGDPVRFLAVLVVATPCPLILAPPIAIIGGINRAARGHVVVRNGAAIEQVARVDAVVFDKTGTLTLGKPQVQSVTPNGTFTREQVLALAGAVEQRSGHLLARTLVEAVRAAGVAIPDATNVVESPGRGVEGIVDGNAVAVGSRDFVTEHLRHDGAAELQASEIPEGLVAFVVVDGVRAGTVVYADRIRANARAVVDELHALGLRRTMLLSGDHAANAVAVAHEVGIADVTGNLRPQDKVDAVTALGRRGHRVMMVGDGTNDAPALAAASVGVALAGHGGGVSAAAADVVILTDDLGRVPEVVRIGRRTMRVARQSILAGLTLSGIAMGVAAFGWLTPALGALLQEGIDVAVVLNALRAASAGRAARAEQSAARELPATVPEGAG